MSVYDLSDVEVKGVLEVLGLRDDHEVETPAATEVSDDDRVNWHRRQKLPPRWLWSLSSDTLQYKLPLHSLCSSTKPLSERLFQAIKFVSQSRK